MLIDRHFYFSNIKEQTPSYLDRFLYNDGGEYCKLTHYLHIFLTEHRSVDYHGIQATRNSGC